jgi:hypothetical protein
MILRTAARVFIWMFFILIIDQVLTLAGYKFRLPVRPVLIYAVIAVGLFAAAVQIERGLAPLKEAQLFFAAFVALVMLGAAMYRGEDVGPDFGGALSVAYNRPSNLGYAIWPAVNLVACAGLFLLGRHREFRRTIIVAAFTALILQVSAMEADMWWPAIFGDANGRAGGLAQNANVAALLVTMLVSLMLPAFAGERLYPFAAYAVMLAAAAVLFSQSKSGGLGAVLCIACFIFAARQSGMRWPHPVFTASLAVVIAGTIWLSPVLNPTQQQIERHQVEIEKKLAEPSEGRLPAAKLDGPVSLSERIESRTSIDESAELRRKALTFYFGILREHPLGMGTGFTNKFVTGPHNEWLKLAVDEGILAPLLLTIIIFGAAWRAIKITRLRRFSIAELQRIVEIRSPALLSIALLSLVGSSFYHTAFVEPLIPAALAIGLAFASNEPDHTAG